jgi:hypothetical protein
MRSLVIPAGFEPAVFWLRARRDTRYSKGPLSPAPWALHLQELRRTGNHTLEGTSPSGEPPAGIEPTYRGYDALVLPLDDGGLAMGASCLPDWHSA